MSPFIKASHQAAGTAAYVGGDVLFDWSSFQVPRGACKLVGVTLVMRGADAAKAANLRDVDLYFAKSISGTAPATLGNANATVSAAPIVSNHIIGMSQVGLGEYGNDAIDYFNVAQTGLGGGAGADTNASQPAVILQGELDSGDNVGYDTLYVGGAVSGTYSFGTTVLARGGEAAEVTTVETDKGGDDDPNADLIFAVGDTLHSATDDVLGKLTSIAAFGSSKQDLGFSAGTTDIIADNEEIFNVYPIRIILSFEK